MFRRFSSPLFTMCGEAAFTITARPRAEWRRETPASKTSRTDFSVMADDIGKNAPRAALITGAGRRIGAAIALTLARAGYSVVLHANKSREAAEARVAANRGREAAERLAAAIAGPGGHASVVLADLADHEAVRGLVPAAAAFGQLTL